MKKKIIKFFIRQRSKFCVLTFNYQLFNKKKILKWSLRTKLQKTVTKIERIESELKFHLGAFTFKAPNKENRRCFLQQHNMT